MRKHSISARQFALSSAAFLKAASSRDLKQPYDITYDWATLRVCSRKGAHTVALLLALHTMVANALVYLTLSTYPSVCKVRWQLELNQPIHVLKEEGSGYWHCKCKQIPCIRITCEYGAWFWFESDMRIRDANHMWIRYSVLIRIWNANTRCESDVNMVFGFDSNLKCEYAIRIRCEYGIRFWFESEMRTSDSNQMWIPYSVLIRIAGVCRRCSSDVNVMWMCCPECHSNTCMDMAFAFTDAHHIRILLRWPMWMPFEYSRDGVWSWIWYEHVIRIAFTCCVFEYKSACRKWIRFASPWGP